MANVSEAQGHIVRLDRCSLCLVPECLFCQAVAGTIPVVTVFSSPAVFAFLDHRPVFKGHVLVLHGLTSPCWPISRRPTSARTSSPFNASRRPVETALGAGGTFVALNNKVSQSVAHLHTHVVPRTKGDGLRGFFWPRTKYASDEEAASYGSRIADALK